MSSLLALALMATHAFAAAPLSVAITAPASGTSHAVASPTPSVSISANATPSSGSASIVSIDYRVNGTSIGTLLGGSSTISWSPTAPGTYTLTAVATDSSSSTNNTLTSSPVTVTVSSVRLASITAPLSNSTVPQNSQLFLRASASMSDGIISKVDFLLNGTTIATASSAPYNADVTLTNAAGTYTLLARATASDGTTTFDSATHTLNIATPIGNGPTVSLTSPAASDVIAVGTAVTVTATASDSDGFIPSSAPGGVTFYADGDPIGTDLTAPYSVSWTPTVSKSVKLHALATDDRGNTRLSTPVTVSVLAAVVPATVSLSAASPVTVNTTTTLTANVTQGSAAISQVQFLSGSTVLGSDNSAPYTFDWTPTATGTFSLTARTTDSSGGTVTSSAVSVTVTSAPVPSVSITSPTNGTNIALGTAATIVASATGNGGATVNRIDFLAGNVTIGTALPPANSISWTPSASGIFALTAKATDTNGATATSSIVNVNVTAPTITLTAPANGATATVGTGVTISATPAAVAPASVARVDFLVGTTVVGSTATAPYAFTWTPTAAGTFSITARVVDSNGATVTSSAASVTVSASTSAPTVSVTAPATGSVVTVGSNVAISADATPPAGATIAQVQFLVGSTIIGTDTSAPYAVNWIPASAANFNLTARALDSNNVSTTSSAITVTAIALPTISITAPSNNSAATFGTAVNVTASPTPSAGATVTGVEFFAGGVSIGTVAASPYTISWTPGTLGAVALTARVTDSAGLSNTSSAINVNVAAGAPTVSLLTPASGTIVTVGTPVTLTANATAAAGATVTQVQFLAGGTIVATVASPGPFTTSWTPTATGNVNLTARVTDSSGNQVTSTAVPVTVNAATSSGVSLSMSPTATTASVGSRRYLTVTVPGTMNVEEVRFFYDGTLIGTDRMTPFILPFNVPAGTGLKLIDAQVIDNTGTTFTSNAITLTVNAQVGAAPTASIVTPAAGAFLPTGTTTAITGTASDQDGTISSVTVYANNAPIGTATVTGTTWTLNWTPTVTGLASLSAIAIDNQFNAVLAPAVEVNITDATSPVVTMTLTPGTGASATTMPAGATRNVVVGATPTTGRAITRVEFFVDGTKAGERTTPVGTNGAQLLYSFRYQAPATPGVHVLAARAYDNADLARDFLLGVTVLTAVGQPPTVSLTTPTSNITVVPNTAVALAALATAPGGTIASVQFYQNGLLVSSVASAPFSSSFTPTTPGAYVFDAIATDDRGNTAVSTAATVTAAFAAPTILFTAPNPNATARATPGVPFSIAVTATPGAGASIQLVEFLLDGAQLGVDTSAPYTFSWTPTTAQIGTHVLTAKVTDSIAQTATTLPVNVNVATSAGAPPSVTITSLPSANLQTASAVNFIATANATAAGATISNVEFFLNEVSIGTATRQQATNTYRLVYDFSRFDFSVLTPIIDANTGAVRYALPLYAIARDSNNSQTVSTTANLTVNAATGLPPTVQLRALVPGAQTVTAGTLYALAATVNDPDGAISNLQLFANGSTTPLFSLGSPSGDAFISFTPNTAGVLNLYAVVTDDTGNSAVSSNVVLTVTGNTAPTVALIRPSDNSTTTTVNTPVFLEATASDPDISQTLTVLFVSTQGQTLAFGTRIGTTDVYRAIWTPTTANTFTIAAQARDSAGGTTTSPVTRRVVVSNVVGIAPSISISVPGSTTTASTVNFTATSSDSDGSVIGVEFFVNRNSIGAAVRDQLTNTWRLTASFVGVPVGTAEVVALARDSSGNVAASATSTMTVNAAQSIAPSITIAAASANVAFSRPVQLSANARDTDGSITSVQYFANGSSIGFGNGTNSQPFVLNWTPTQSGTFNVYAVATDASVNGVQNTTISAPIQVTVRRNNPVLDDSAFILQAFSDIANTTSVNAIILAELDAQLAAGTLTRAQLVANLTAETGFVAPVNFLATYYTIMGQWPTPAIYNSLIGTARGSMANAVGSVIASQEYIAKYPEHTVPTVALLNSPTGVIPATTFLQRLWTNAGRGGSPSPLDDQQFRNSDTANVTLGIARGYNVAGLNTAIAEFVTIKNASNTALFTKAKAAALYYQLNRPQTPSDQTAQQITDAIAARVNTLAALPDTVAMADAVLKDTLFSYRWVTILKHPESLTVNPRSGAIFRVEALGAPPLAYQWLLNGAPIPNATTATLSLTNVDTSRVGTYTVVVTSAQNSATSDPATLTLTSTVTRLANISTRGVTSGGANVLIGGFVVQGTSATQTRQVLIRVVGPTLGQAPFSLTGVLADPRLELYNSTSTTPIQANDDWGTQTGGATALAALRQATTRAGAFTLANNSDDAAILATLQPGNYTVQARGPTANASGVVLMEVYDVTAGSAVGPKASNVSTRGEVGTGNNVLIAGFVVNGAASRRMLIRGVDPTLRNFGLGANAVLADPQISLAELNSGKVLATNNDWATSDDAAVIAQAASAAGAFALQNASKDAAMIVMLPPGAYTVTLTGVANTTGIGIVEVYDVDP